MSRMYLGNQLLEKVLIDDKLVRDTNAKLKITDADAEAFFTATNITNTGLQDAVTLFVVDLKENNLWDKMVQIIPFVADNPNTGSMGLQFRENLKSPGTNNITFKKGTSNTLDLVDSDFNGFKADRGSPTPSDSARYVDTNIFASNPIFDNGMHVTVYTTDATQTGDVWDWGANDGGASSILITGRSFDGTNVQKISQLMSTGGTNITEAGTAGCTIASTSVSGSNADLIFMQNGVVKDTLSSTVRSRSSLRRPYFGAANTNNNSSAQSSRRYQLYTWGTALTQSEMSTLNTIVQNFQQRVDNAMGTSRKV